MNCRNCGAPVSGRKCEYCGTEYKSNPTFHLPHVTPEESKKYMEMFSNGNMYVEEIVREPIIIDSGRNENGEMLPSKIMYKTKVKMVEV